MKGIILCAFGARGYGFTAVNLAMTIKKHSPDIPIHLVCEKKTMDQIPHDYMQWFDIVEYCERNVDEPGAQKWIWMMQSDFEWTLFLDVDAICIGDITPWMDALIEKMESTGTHISTQCMGVGKLGDDGISYDLWMDHSNVEKYFGYKPGTPWITTQTSWVLFDNSIDAIRFNAGVVARMNFVHISQLKNRWGKFIPDELGVSLTIPALMDSFCPHTSDDFIFFGNTYKELNEIKSKYKIISMYGNGGGNSLVKPYIFEFIDRYLIEQYRSHNLNHIFKTHYIMTDKMLSQR